jgi:bifunctional DNase/RNase
MDARPGDAVALALRADVPIHINDEILANSGYGPG